MHSCKKPAAERLDYAYRGSNFILVHVDFTADNGAGVVGLLHILFIDYAHFVCKKMAFLKNPASSFPFSNGRNCGFNVDCKKIQANDDNVVWQFAIQGYEHDWTHGDCSVMAQGILTVVYRLKDPPAAVLKTVEKK